MGRAVIRLVLLVGFMASGKSTVGRRLARELGWTFVDVDAEVEDRAGRSIPELFRLEGEAAFRAMEAEVTAEVLTGERCVVATGGGWPAAEGRMEELPEDVLSVWLRVSPEEAARRAGGRGDRPLLDVVDPVGRARELLAQREPFYRQADLHLDTGSRGVGAVVRTILEHTTRVRGTRTHGPV